MEAISTEFLRKFEDALVENGKKLDCILIFETALAQLKYEKVKGKEESKKDENQKANALEGTSMKVPKQLTSKECTGTIQQTVLDITKLDMTGEYSEYVIIGGLKWKMQICAQSDDVLLFFLNCENDNYEDSAKFQSQWQCTAKYNLRVMDQLKTRSCHLEKNMGHFEKGNYSSYCKVKLNDLLNCRNDKEKINTVHIEMEIVVLDTSVNLKLESAFQNPDYQQLLGTFTHKFGNILTSNLDEKTLESPQFNVVGFPWVLSISNFMNGLKVALVCDPKLECDRGWSCEAKAEVRLLKQSRTDTVYSRYETRELHEKDSCLTLFNFIPLYKLMNPKNYYINNGSIVIEVHITIYRPKNSKF